MGALLDSGAGAHVIPESSCPGAPISQQMNPMRAQYPDGTVVTSLGTTSLDFDGEQTVAYVMKDRNLQKPIASLSALMPRGSGRWAVYDEEHVWIFNRENIAVLEGERSVADDLWYIINGTAELQMQSATHYAEIRREIRDKPNNFVNRSIVRDGAKPSKYTDKQITDIRSARAEILRRHKPDSKGDRTVAQYLVIAKEYKDASRRILGKVDYDVYTLNSSPEQNTGALKAGKTRVVSMAAVSDEKSAETLTNASDPGGCHSYVAKFPPLSPELRNVLETHSINGELFTRAYDLAAQATGTHQVVNKDEHYFISALARTRDLSRQELAALLMRTFPASVDTVRQALHLNFLKVPWITYKEFVANLPPTTPQIATGNSTTQRKNVRSTKPEMQKPDVTDMSPPDLGPIARVESVRGFSDRRRQIFVKSARQTQDGKLYLDATGDFPVTSWDGMSRVILFLSSCGYIHLETVRDHTGAEMARAFAAAHVFFSKSREVPTWAILDNEISGELQSKMGELKVHVKRVPPDEHWKNAAERAIRWFKSFFISVLFGVDESCPANMWSSLLPGVELYMSLLTPSKRNPLISTYQDMFGNLDFDAIIFARLGQAVQVNIPVAKRTSYGPRSEPGIYLGPALDSFRTHLVYMPSSKHIRRAGSCEFITLDAQFPGVTSEDKLVAAFKDVVEALKGCAIERHGKPEGTTLDTLAKTFGDKFAEAQEALFPPDVTDAERSTTPPQPQPAELQLPIGGGDAQRVGRRVAAPQSRGGRDNQDVIVDVGQQIQEEDDAIRGRRTPSSMTLVPLVGEQSQGHQSLRELVVSPNEDEIKASEEAIAKHIKSDREAAERLAADLKAHDAAEASKGDQDIVPFTTVSKKKKKTRKAPVPPTAAKKASKDQESMGETSDAKVLASRRKILEEKKERIKTTTEHVEVAELLDFSSKWKELLAAEAKLKGKAKRVRQQQGTIGHAKDRGRLSGTSVLQTLMTPAKAMPINAIERVYMQDTSYQRLLKVQKFCLSSSSLEHASPSQRDQQLQQKVPVLEDAQKRAELRKLLSRVVSLQEHLKSEPGLRLVNMSATQAKIVDALGGTWMELYYRKDDDAWYISHYKGVKAEHIYKIWERDITVAWDSHTEYLQSFPDPLPVSIYNTVSSTSADLNLDPITMQPITFTTVMRGKDKDLWWNATSVEWRRLYANDTLRFISWDLLPVGATITYVSIVVRMKQLLHGELQRRVRVVLGGDRQPVEGARSSPVATWGQIKTLINSHISTPGAKICTADIKDFYLKSKLTDPAYFQIHIDKLPQDIIDEFKLRDLVNKKGMLLAKVTGGMYGHPQAGLFAYKELRAHLALHGFTSQETTPCVFANADYSVVFTLVVDDFLIKARSQTELKCILDVLKLKYEITVDENQQRQFYNGVQFNFDTVTRGGRQVGRARLSVPKYISSALRRFRCEDIVGAHTPAAAESPVKYSLESQMMAPDAEPVLLSAYEKRTQQEIVGVLLWYSMIIHLPAVIAVAEAASAGDTEDKAEKTRRLLAYFKQYPDACLTFYASDMILTGVCDASFASRPDGRSRAGICYYFRSEGEGLEDYNGMIEAKAKTIKLIMLSAAEAEYVTVFYTAEGVVALAQAAEAMGHKQGTIRICTDNRVAVGLANSTMNIKRTRTINTKFHWIRERVQAGEFEICWIPGDNNVADAFTKPLPRTRYQKFLRMLVSFPGQLD